MSSTYVVPAVTEVERELIDAGNDLMRVPSSSIAELLALLERAEKVLVKVDQQPFRSTQDALTPLRSALTRRNLFRSSNTDIKILVTVCITEITRISAPYACYGDDLMREYYKLAVDAIERMSLLSGRYYKQAWTTLYLLAHSRSCLMMLDLGCYSLIIRMFQIFLRVISSEHLEPEAVFKAMETAMTLIINESVEVEIRVGLLNPILASVTNANQISSPTSWKLGQKVLSNCAAKIRSLLKEMVNATGIALDEYSPIVASICQNEVSALANDNGTGAIEVEHLEQNAVLNGECARLQAEEKHKVENGSGSSMASEEEEKVVNGDGLSTHAEKKDKVVNGGDFSMPLMDENEVVNVEGSNTSEEEDKLVNGEDSSMSPEVTVPSKRDRRPNSLLLNPDEGYYHAWMYEDEKPQSFRRPNLKDKGSNCASKVPVLEKPDLNSRVEKEAEALGDACTVCERISSENDPSESSQPRKDKKLESAVARSTPLSAPQDENLWDESEVKVTKSIESMKVKAKKKSKTDPLCLVKDDKTHNVPPFQNSSEIASVPSSEKILVREKLDLDLRHEKETKALGHAFKLSDDIVSSSSIPKKRRAERSRPKKVNNFLSVTAEPCPLCLTKEDPLCANCRGKISKSIEILQKKHIKKQKVDDSSLLKDVKTENVHHISSYAKESDTSSKIPVSEIQDLNLRDEKGIQALRHASKVSDDIGPSYSNLKKHRTDKTPLKRSRPKKDKNLVSVAAEPNPVSFSKEENSRAKSGEKDSKSIESLQKKPRKKSKVNGSSLINDAKTEEGPHLNSYDKNSDSKIPFPKIPDLYLQDENETDALGHASEACENIVASFPIQCHVDKSPCKKSQPRKQKNPISLAAEPCPLSLSKGENMVNEAEAINAKPKKKRKEKNKVEYERRKRQKKEDNLAKASEFMVASPGYACAVKDDKVLTESERKGLDLSASKPGRVNIVYDCSLSELKDIRENSWIDSVSDGNTIEASDSKRTFRCPMKISSGDINQLKDTANSMPKGESSIMKKVASQMPYHGGDLVGRRLRIWWPMDEMFYKGIVSSYNPKNEIYQVLYDDGDIEYLDLKKERWELAGDEVLMEELEMVDDNDVPQPDNASNPAETQNQKRKVESGKPKRAHSV